MTPRVSHPWVTEQERRLRFGVFNAPAADWPALRAWVQTAERLGFDSFWIQDHPMLAPIDCWTALAALAVSTERLRLGPLVSCAAYRPPALLARMAADVDRLSGGRLVLGLGAGDFHKEFAQLGLAEPPFRQRAAALAETVGLLRELWTGAPVTRRGAHVRVEDARLTTVPVQAPHIPLLLAGGGERVTLRQVAQHADACNFGPSDATGAAWGPPDVRRKLAALAAHCAALGRPPAAVLRSHVGTVLLGETEAAVAAKLAPLRARAGVVEDDRTPDEPHRLRVPIGLPSLETATGTLLAGTPPQLVAHYRALAAAGMRYFIVHCSREEETLRLLGEAVLPHVTAPPPAPAPTARPS
jgi:alkanesulfonate monooxygenase SsuD/methylene tetrahydromethanopterin reductase-like flavin-dependent oxidoreductase (luciferase family)